MRTKAKFYVLLVYKGFQKKGKLSLEYIDPEFPA